VKSTPASAGFFLVEQSGRQTGKETAKRFYDIVRRLNASLIFPNVLNDHERAQRHEERYRHKSDDTPRRYREATL
jgi:hypothetical protein